MSEKDDLIYDEDESVKFIQNYLPQELKGKFSNDDINYIVDLIYDFYESRGYLNDDADDNTDIEIDEDELIEYVIKKRTEGWRRQIRCRSDQLYRAGRT